ncbi:MAG TPA: hypothetical protein VD998_01785 [Verrucomicrobiae bacterium]|nr:hypothetical protein [Verrucomicrobiae bacterium]
MKNKINKYISKLSKRHLISIVIILLGLATYFSINVFKKENFDHLETLALMRQEEKPVFAQMRESLPELLKKGGVTGALNLAADAFKKEDITMYECHTFSHLLGHHSPLSDEENLRVIMDFGPEFCEGGFKHGLESQIVLSEVNFKERLHRFCDVLIQNNLGGCFHGAGHTFMRQALDALTAVKLCDELVQTYTHSITDCYTGIFSEYTNLAGGVDGETGLEFPDGPAILLKNPPLDICSSLPDHMQLACALELNGLGISEQSKPEDIDRKLRECVAGKHRFELQKACVQSVAAVGAQHELPKTKEMKVLPFALTLSPEFRASYIVGAATEMKQFLKNGVNKNWQVFCNGFKTTEDKTLCESILK